MTSLESRLRRKEQAILLLNRRGHSTWVSCDACGWIAICRSCNVSLTWHRNRGRLVCHHCAHEEPSRERCPDCGEETLVYTGVGTEQVERRLGEWFPEARIARMDVDTTGRKWSHRDILDSVRREEIDILLGTQMISKGLDLPGVTLVGVIDADVGLNLPDFRASERTFQLLAQVAGRAGRGTRPGEVLVQTSRPSHFEPGYPPHLRLANLVVSGRDEKEVESAALALGEWLEGLVSARPEVAGTGLLGPAPCPIDRLRGRWRWHMLIKQAHAGRLGAILRFTATHAPVPGNVRLEIDRDPENLL
ncbi:MAG: primosomal protein N' [Gemmatimonadota bacterium]